MADPKFWRDVQVAIIGGIVVALLGVPGTWLLGWWPAIWAAAGGALKATWSVLAYSIPVPASVLVVLVGGLVIGVRLWWRSSAEAAGLRLDLRKTQALELAASARLATQLQAELLAKPPAAARFQPSELQDRVLRALAKVDGSTLYLSDLRKTLQVAQLLFDQAIDGLNAQGLLYFSKTPSGRREGTFLSPDGRDFVIDAGYVGGTT